MLAAHKLIHFPFKHQQQYQYGSTTSRSNYSTRFLSPRPFPPPPPSTAVRIPASRIFSPPLRAFNSFAGAGDVIRDAGATALVLAGAYSLVSAFDNLTQQNIITQSLSRKLVHILSGLLFMACWPLFSTSAEARYFASLVPLTNFLRLLVNGLSPAPDEGLIKSVTREGKPEELLRGPLYYVLVLVVCSIVFWRESPVGIISLAMMCGGDGNLSIFSTADPIIYFGFCILTLSSLGFADIMGRKFGYVKIPYNQTKSWAGSISMFAFGSLISLGMMYYFSALGYFQLDWFTTVQRVVLVSFIATVVESLPTTQLMDDNISVPVIAMLTAYLCFCL